MAQNPSAPEPRTLDLRARVRAITFDVFGTVVDWRSSVAREVEAVLAVKGHALDWAHFADRWRARYQPAMGKVRTGQRPFAILDELHRENLIALLEEEGVGGLSEPEIDHLNRAWHRLDPWPDAVEGLTRLKRRFIVATLSNGNVALLVSMAKRANLPWDAVLGAEVARAYKPRPEAYDRTAAMLGLEPGQCLMVAAHPTDLAAAASRGFRTAYVHRPLEYGRAHVDRPAPEQGVDILVDSLTELAGHLGV
jgi:2-haloacid dehalogenase